MTYLLLLLGLLLLIGGGEALVKGSVMVATRLGVSPLLIGLTLVGFGTSTPELVASLQAALRESPGIALGNVVGSNIGNILLILGLSAVVLPLRTTAQAFRRDGTVLIASSALMAGMALYGSLGRAAGVVCLLLLLAYTTYTYLNERNAPDAPSAQMHSAEAAELADLPPRVLGLPAASALVLAAIAATVTGAYLLVEAALVIARQAGLSETVLGLTLVAVGTSLPELVTSVMAAVRGHADIAFGNVVGSNIFNVLGVAGVTAIVRPIPVPAPIAAFDVWVMLGASGLLVAFAATGLRVNRWEGAAFLLTYGAYLAVQLSPPLRAMVGLP